MTTTLAHTTARTSVSTANTAAQILLSAINGHEFEGACYKAGMQLASTTTTAAHQARAASTTAAADNYDGAREAAEKASDAAGTASDLLAARDADDAKDIGMVPNRRAIALAEESAKIAELGRACLVAAEGCQRAADLCSVTRE